MNNKLKWISQNAKIGENLQTGMFCIIEDNVSIGNNVTLGHHVIIKEGTIIMDNVTIADGCYTTGACVIGRNVKVRTSAVISKCTIIEDNVFIGPGVITNHTKKVTPEKTQQLITYISYGSVIGSQVSIVAGVHIAPLCIIGAGAVVTKDINEYGIYVGSPARKISDDISDYEQPIPPDAGEMYNKEKYILHIKRWVRGLE